MTLIVFMTRCDDLCQLTRLDGLLGLDGRCLGRFPAEYLPELVGAIRVNLRVIPGTRDGDIRQTAVDEPVVRLLGIDFDEYLRRRKLVVATTNSNHTRPVYPNLARGMALTGITQLWVADIAYIRLELEFVYVAVIPDAF